MTRKMSAHAQCRHKQCIFRSSECTVHWIHECRGCCTEQQLKVLSLFHLSPPCCTQLSLPEQCASAVSVCLQWWSPLWKWGTGTAGSHWVNFTSVLSNRFTPRLRAPTTMMVYPSARETVTWTWRSKTMSQNKHFLFELSVRCFDHSDARTNAVSINRNYKLL